MTRFANILTYIVRCVNQDQENHDEHYFRTNRAIYDIIAHAIDQEPGGELGLEDIQDMLYVPLYQTGDHPHSVEQMQEMLQHGDLTSDDGWHIHFNRDPEGGYALCNSRLHILNNHFYPDVKTLLINNLDQVLRIWTFVSF